MKKFLSLFLSLCLAMGLATQVFAASTEVLFRSSYNAGGNPDGPGGEDVLDVVVPAEILLHMNQDGDIQVSRTLAIENRSAKAVKVESIRVEGRNGWDVVGYDTDFSGKPADTKDLALSFRGDGTDDAGDIVPTPRNWDISAGDSILINAAARMPTQAGTDRTGIATVYWVIDWADDNGGVDQPENPDVGKYPIDVSVNDGEHGKADADKITTDDEGRIPQFPGVTSDPGYIHDGWENQDGNPVDETTKFNPGDEIWPTFKPDSDYNPDKTVTVPVLPGDYGSAGVDSVMTDSDGKINSYPGVTPEPGWLFDGYVDQDGEPVDENTVFEDGDKIKPVFKADPDYKPDLTVTVEVLPGEHGRSPSTSVITDSDGKIRTYPGVNADEGYVFDHWTDRDGNSVDENTVFKRGDAIIPVFVEDPDYDRTVVVEILPGTNGTCPDDFVTTDGDGKIVNWPDVEPDDGYMFDKWVDEDGTTVDENTVFSDGDKIRPVFKVIEYIPFTITPSNRTEVGYTGAVDENLVIPETFRGSDGNYYKVVAIGGNAFHQCANLTGVTIPSTVKTIDNYAFSYSGLKSVYIPDSVTTLGRNCFEACKSMTSIRFSPNAKTIQYMCCAGCKSLTSVTIPSGITTIETAAFQCPRSIWGYTSPLSSLTLPSSLRTIGDAVFSGTSIGVLRVPSSVSSIGYNAFYDISTIYYSGSASGSPWGAYQVKK